MAINLDDNSITASHIFIEVVYALPTEQKIYSLEVRPDCTVAQAIKQSTILEDYPVIDLDKDKVGIFSKVCKLSDGLHHNDRIEIYRALIIDPKEARKKRAAN
ncbi:MAG: RnfH family protein [Kangiellaceae bacterium]|nr:RnfH family protein [Kangiellaceae bacterium]